jgi:hypothetical protein
MTPKVPSDVVYAAGAVFCLGAAAVAIWGGISMKQRGNHGLAITGSIALMLASGMFCFVSVPIGVWLLIVLRRPEVKSSFKR